MTETSVPGIGDPAPSVALVDYDTGSPVVLSTEWAEKACLLVFQRYYGCPFCQLHIARLLEDREKLLRHSNVVLIGHGRREKVQLGKAFAPFHVLFDETLEGYRAFGLGRGTLSQVGGPDVWLPYLRAHMKTGVRQRRLRGGDLMQLPGTFIVDTSGTIRMAHRNRTAADNPHNRDVLQVLVTLDRSPRR